MKNRILKKIKFFIDSIIRTFIDLNIYIKVIDVISIVLFVAGFMIRNEIVINISVLLLFFLNVFILLKNPRTNFVNLMFHFAIFIFILGKPLIYTLQLSSVPRKEFYSASINTVAFGVGIILLSLLFIQFGTKLYEKLFLRDDYINEKEYSFNKQILRLIILVVMIFSFLASMATVVEKVIFMQSHNYFQYNYLFSSSLPLLIKALAQLFFPCMIMYLATMPKRNQSFIILCMYILTCSGDFVVGMRSKIILPIVFSFLYFLVRQLYIANYSQKWVTKKMLILIAVLIPFMFSGLYIYNYIRADVSISDVDIENPVLSFVDQQGQTYLLLTTSYSYMDEVKPANYFGYTVGPIVNKVMYNRVSRTIFGTPELVGQTPETIEYSDNFNFQISYTIMGDLFFSGAGTGSSYVLDIYYDFSYIGIGIFSLILGLYLSGIVRILKQNYFLTCCCLVSLTSLIYMVRDNALSSLVECFDVYNIFTFIFIFILYQLVIRLGWESRISKLKIIKKELL